ncbi:MAG: hypothetical protein AB8B93_08140 [Pseudomonadales bacterium]
MQNDHPDNRNSNESTAATATDPHADHRSLISDQPESAKERHFHGWRLLGGVMVVVVVLAVVSAVVDWLVIGPLEGRAPWL